MYFVYDKDGNKFKVNHKVDQMSALRTGKYTKKPPGAPEPEPIPEPAKGEVAEGISVEEKKEEAKKEANLNFGERESAVKKSVKIKKV